MIVMFTGGPVSQPTSSRSVAVWRAGKLEGSHPLPTILAHSGQGAIPVAPHLADPLRLPTGPPHGGWSVHELLHINLSELANWGPDKDLMQKEFVVHARIHHVLREDEPNLVATSIDWPVSWQV